MAIKTAILGGLFADQQILSIQKLAQDFGVSTTPIREALKRLAAEELVEWIPNKGPRVKQMTEEEVCQLFKIRWLIEPYFWQLIGIQVKRDSSLETELLELKRNIQTLLVGLQQNTADAHFLEEYTKIDIWFQRLISERQPSELIVIKKFADFLNNYIFRLPLFSKKETGPTRTARMKDVLMEHLAILDSLLMGNPAQIERAVRNHLVQAEIRSLRAFEESRERRRERKGGSSHAGLPGVPQPGLVGDGVECGSQEVMKEGASSL